MAVALLLPLAACAPRPTATPGPDTRVDLAPRLDSLTWATREALVFVEGGAFLMGDQGARFVVGLTGAIDSTRGHPDHIPWTHNPDNKPAHEVVLTSYSMQPTEVTFGDYDLFTTVTGRDSVLTHGLGKYYRGPRYPAGVPSWQAARDYCLWLGELTGLAMDLPTEAQWEYAARSRGRNVAFATDGDSLVIAEDEAHPRAAGIFYVTAPQGNAAASDIRPVASYPPNALGLYDMTSNVAEWVLDWYAEDTYARRAARGEPAYDPQGPPTGEEKIFRGGYVGQSKLANHVYLRMEMPPDDWGEDYGYNGFRCVANESEPVASPFDIPYPEQVAPRTPVVRTPIYLPKRN